MAGYIGSKASVVSSGAERKKTFTITGATTSLTGLNYTVGKVHVFQNGVRLVDGTDYTATNGTTITLTVAAQSGDNVVVISQASYQVALSGIDDQSNATAITIDSNEKVLVGKTSAGYNVDGFEAHPNGETYVSRSGTPMAINRNSSDGTLLNFYKDGTTVGSIGSKSGSLLIGSTDTYLRVNDPSDTIFPSNSSGAERDNTINLGKGSSRFKDAYLSGGVYLGGIVSANKLDDYEEGTFNLTMAGYYSSPNTTQLIPANYVKIGNTVNFIAYKGGVNNTGAGGNMYFTGLPFATINRYPVGGIQLDYLGTYPSNSAPFTHISGTIVYAMRHVSNGSAAAVFHNVYTNGSVYLSGTYQTNA